MVHGTFLAKIIYAGLIRINKTYVLGLRHDGQVISVCCPENPPKPHRFDRLTTLVVLHTNVATYIHHLLMKAHHLSLVVNDKAQ